MRRPEEEDGRGALWFRRAVHGCGFLLRFSRCMFASLYVATFSSKCAVQSAPKRTDSSSARAVVVCTNSVAAATLARRTPTAGNSIYRALNQALRVDHQVCL